MERDRDAGRPGHRRGAGRARHGVSFNGYADRTYPGRLFAAVDASGVACAVADIGMERLSKEWFQEILCQGAHQAGAQSPGR